MLELNVFMNCNSVFEAEPSANFAASIPVANFVLVTFTFPIVNTIEPVTSLVCVAYQNLRTWF